MSDGVLVQSERSASESINGEHSQRGVAQFQVAPLRRRIVERAARAVNNVASRPLRSLALIAAFALAFAGLIGAAGIGATASAQISQRLTAAARDEVRVNLQAQLPAAERARWSRSVGQLDHVRALGQMGAIEAATANVSRFDRSVRAAASFSGTTVALNADALSAVGATVSPAGSKAFFESDELENVALVGRDAARTLGVGESAQGTEIWVNDEPYTVVGIVTASDREKNLLTSVMVPVDRFDYLSTELVVRTDPGYSRSVAEAIPLAVDPAAPGDVDVQTTGELKNLRLGVQTDLNGLLGSLSVALLLVAVLSGASAMYLSVQARTQELALSRALGLGELGVAAIFLWEGAIVGLAGALAGLAGGLCVTVAVAAAQSWTVTMPWSAVAVVPVLGALCGALAALLPAIRAARLDPADAIR